MGICLVYYGLSSFYWVGGDGEQGRDSRNNESSQYVAARVNNDGKLMQHTLVTYSERVFSRKMNTIIHFLVQKDLFSLEKESQGLLAHVHNPFPVQKFKATQLPIYTLTLMSIKSSSMPE